VSTSSSPPKFNTSNLGWTYSASKSGTRWLFGSWGLGQNPEL
jgi:hypothetical protein